MFHTPKLAIDEHLLQRFMRQREKDGNEPRSSRHVLSRVRYIMTLSHCEKTPAHRWPLV